MLLKKKHDHQYLRGTKEILFEALWPTACLGCNMPETLVCDSCLKNLHYIDSFAACPHCGSPYGRIQCCECNPVMLETFELKELPYTSCRSAVLFEDTASRIITFYKDRGERRLAPLIARIMRAYLPPRCQKVTEGYPTMLTFIPASMKAYRARGFDHMQLLTQHLSELIGLSVVDLFERPKAKNQRTLTRKDRYQNMQGQFVVKPGAVLPSSVLVFDDVYTTGSTLISASETLIKSGVEQVHCMTFARVL